VKLVLSFVPEDAENEVEATWGEGELLPGAMTKECSFSRAGQFEFACHLPGHYEAGMARPVSVN